MMDVLIRYVPKPVAPKPGSFTACLQLPIMRNEFNPAARKYRREG